MKSVPTCKSRVEHMIRINWHYSQADYEDGEKLHLLVASWLKKIWSSIATGVTLTFEIIKPEQKNNINSNCEDGEMFHLLVGNWLKEIWSSVTAMISEVGDNVNNNQKKKKKSIL